MRAVQNRAAVDPIVSALTLRRHELRMSQMELADRAGMARAEVSRIESASGGRVPNLVTVRRMAKALGCDLVLVPNEPGGQT